MTQEEILEIQRAQQGSQTAFASLVARYENRVMRLAMSYCASDEDASDIFQEVFLRVFRSLSGFRFDSAFSTWLHRVTLNVCLTHRSRAARRGVVSIDDMSEQEIVQRSTGDILGRTTETITEAADVLTLVRKVVTALSPRQKLCFALKFFDGHSIREIAALLECSEGSVKRHVYEATKRVRTQLRHLYE